MERNQELTKLINVLRQTSRMAMQATWTGGDDDVAVHCIAQYNKVLARLKELEPGLASLFDPLPEDSSLTVVAMACRQLGAYFEDEAHTTGPWGPGFWGGRGGNRPPFDPEAFREFWQKSASGLEDIGDYIREQMERWAECGRPRSQRTGAKGTETSGEA